MLPSSLLLVRRRKGQIRPRYARLSPENLQLARTLIETYGSHIGAKKGIIRESASELEEMGYDYRFVRGLSFQLDRRAIFECEAKIDPVDTRREIFQEAGRAGLPTTDKQRDTIIRVAASRLKLKPEQVEESFYADLEDELVLKEFSQIAPQDLLRKYNLSLTQTLLFNATELAFTTSGRWQQIFRSIKRLGLIYEVYEDGGLHTKIDGPASLFKMDRRYGTSMAKLVPLIVSNPEWTLDAKIHWKYTNEICHLRIESRKHSEVLETPEIPIISFDSAVEEDFSKRFQTLRSGWRLQREPEPVTAGRYIVIPDFSFEKEGIKIYMEIVGFWTTEYLTRKIKKLEKTTVDMLVAVDKALACERLQRLGKHEKLNLVYYHKRIPLSPILRHLNSALKELRERQIKLLKDLTIAFAEPIVNYAAFAAEVGVSTEAVKDMLKERPPKDYIPLEDSLVKKERLEQVGKTLAEKAHRNGRLSLIEAQKIIEEEKVKDSSGVLKILGYRIVWRGIDPENAEVIRINHQQAKGLPS